MVAGIESNRPRNVDTKRAAAILYGDWGTSKAYVIGLAFAFAGYSSFWLIAAMCVVTALVAINYIVICKHYPDGGGVYASVRHRSEIISIVGAFLLIADYIVTAALSALSAFQYLGLPHPEKFAALSIALIGGLNWFGPKHTGGLAFVVSIPTAVVVVLLGALGLPYLSDAWHHVQPLTGGCMTNWTSFVSIVLALSGVEAVANSTGVMRLDPDSPDGKPSVTRTSTPAILWVMAEVVIFTGLLGLLMHALPGLQRVTYSASDPGVDAMHPEVMVHGVSGVRDYMLRYMGETFAGNAFGPTAGHLMGILVSIVFGVLLLSAVNTAIGALISTQYLMGRDRELPSLFRKLNSFGVPTWGLFVSALVPLVLVLVVSDLSGLAELYAVGVVGAIATNLGACSTDRKLELRLWERGMMFVTFIIMVVIELSLLIDKPAARTFAVAVLAIGLVMRSLGREQAQRGAFLVVLAMIGALFAFRDIGPAFLALTVLAVGLILRGLLGERKAAKELRGAVAGAPLAGLAGAGVGSSGSTFPGLAEAAGLQKVDAPVLPVANSEQATGTPLLCAVRGIGKTLDFALEDARETNRPLYLLFVREQPVITSEDRKRRWRDDEEAREIFSYAHAHAGGAVILPGYAVSDSPADTIVDFAATIGASRLMLGAPSRSGLINLLRGNIIRQVSDLLPEDIHLLVYA